jgi:hypothetical protein
MSRSYTRSYEEEDGPHQEGSVMFSAAADIVQVAHDVGHKLKRQLGKCRCWVSEMSPQH